MPDLFERLRKNVEVATPEQSKEFFKENDFRWGETLTGEDSPTGKPLIFINDEKFQQAGSTNFRDKAIKGESLHLLKDVAPNDYARLRIAANNDPEYQQWARESYRRSVAEGETRPFNEWHDRSRLDQVIGGFLFAGDEDLPTMKEWSRKDLPFGTVFRNELERLDTMINK